jgi:hypothetical protein
LGRLKRAPDHIKLGDIQWGDFLERRLETTDRKVNLAPPEFTEAVPEALDDPPMPTAGHTYQSGMRTSRKYPGINVNFLHDDRVHRLTGMPVFNGTPCRVSRV